MKIFKKITAIGTTLMVLATLSIIPQNVLGATIITSGASSPMFSWEEVSTGRYLTTSDVDEYKYDIGTRIVYEIEFGANPTGYLVNIGDSSTNNAGGGDGYTQTNDAEVQIVDGTLSIFANDTGRGALIASVPNCAPANGKIRLEIYNNKVTYINYTTRQVMTWESNYLFALDGRYDMEGPVNYKIYGGFNGVVQRYCNRVGSGVTRVNVIHEYAVHNVRWLLHRSDELYVDTDQVKLC